MGYLKWALEKLDKLTIPMKEAIKKQISDFEFLAR